jgi:3-methyladenine DNA glycosylase/8-oxoguanine DNA glycosylase
MKAIIDAVGPYTLRFERDRFGLLVRSIISQQISTSAARAIRKRLMDLVSSDGLTAESLARYTSDELRSVGLSPQKASYVRCSKAIRIVSSLEAEAIEPEMVGVHSDGREGSFAIPGRSHSILIEFGVESVRSSPGVMAF